MFWRKKKKKEEENEEEILEELEREFERAFRVMNRVMRKMIEEGEPEGFRRRPIVHGIKITIGPNGVPKVEEFGNVKPAAKKVSEYREPLVDVMEKDKEIIVTVELPGVDKKDIRVKVIEDKLYIQAESDPFKYRKVVSLPAPVDVKSASASFKNGILEIKMKKVSELPDKGQEIKVS